MLRRDALVIVLAGLFTFALSWFALAQHRALTTQMNDLGNADQAIWRVTQGDWLMQQSNDTDGALRSRLAVHTNFIFYPLALLYLVWPSPVVLLIVTSLASGIAGVGLYALARHFLGTTWWAIVPPLAFWVSPLTHQATLYDFHVVTLVAALFVWMLWAFTTGRRRVGWVLLGLALLCSEDVALLIFMYGVYRYLTGERREGRLIMGVSALYFFVIVVLLIPLLNDGRGLTKLVGPRNRYGWLGHSGSDIITSLVSQPVHVVGHLLQPDRLRLPLYLLLLGGIAAGRAWRLLLVLLPTLLATMLTTIPWVTRLTGTYYWVTSGAVIVVAGILSAAQLRQKQEPTWWWPLAYLFVAATFFSLLFSPLPHGRWATWQQYQTVPEYASLAEVHRLIPPEASLCIQNNLGPHFSQRADIASFPRRCETAQYALFFLRPTPVHHPFFFLGQNTWYLVGDTRRGLADSVAELVAAPEWGLTAYHDGFYVLQRNAADTVSLTEAQALIEHDTARGPLFSPWTAHPRWLRFINDSLRWSEVFGR